MIEKCIATLFLDREITHREHLKTNSYAQHIALKTFYDDIVDMTDAIVEAYQGRNGIIKNIPILSNDKPDLDIADILETHLARIERMRYQAVPEKDTAIQSLIDDVIILYLSTIYKLKNLK